MKLYLYSVEDDSAAHKWDYGLLKEFCERKKIEQIRVNSLPQEEKAFVAIPAPSNAGHEEQISNELNKINKVTLFVMGDEAATFNVDKINHPHISIWIQYPHDRHQQYNKFPQGVPQHFKNHLPQYQNKQNDLYFSGQINHNRRTELASILPTIPNSMYNFTEGFTKGDDPITYYNNMIKAKFVPCPSGIVVLDSFRFYEALELLCYPILDMKDPTGIQPRYFERLFDHSMPIVATDSWYNLQSIMINLDNDYYSNLHRVVCWWIKYKRDLFNKIMEWM